MGLSERVATVAILLNSGSPSNWSGKSDELGRDTGRQMAQFELSRLRRVWQDVREGKPVFLVLDRFYSRMALHLPVNRKIKRGRFLLINRD